MKIITEIIKKPKPLLKPPRRSYTYQISDLHDTRESADLT